MAVLVLTSFAVKSHAVVFAKKLVGQKLAACCTILPGVLSIYQWKGKQQSAKEVLLLIKTAPAKIAAMNKFFNVNHPYELPEFLKLGATASRGFESWIGKQTK